MVTLTFIYQAQHTHDEPLGPGFVRLYVSPYKLIDTSKKDAHAITRGSMCCCRTVSAIYIRTPERGYSVMYCLFDLGHCRRHLYIVQMRVKCYSFKSY